MSTKHVSSLPTSVSGRTPTTSSGVTHSAISGMSPKITRTTRSLNDLYI
jgi:hypothetical protein